MAFGLHEYPHTDLYDSDLSEMLKFYHKLVDDYNEIVQKMRDSQRQWQESMDYVEHWNRKWQQDMAEMRKDFVDKSKELRDLQLELLDRFEKERTGMQSFMTDTLEQIKADNRKRNADFDELIKKRNDEFKELTEIYQTRFHDSLEDFQSAFQASLDGLDIAFKNNMGEFKNFVGDEMDTIMSLFESYQNMVDNYYKSSMGKFTDATDKYEKLLNRTAAELSAEYTKRLLTKVDVDNFENYTDQMYSTVEQLEKKIKEARDFRIMVQTDELLVVSPVTGRLKRIQWTLDEMWRGLQVWGIEMHELRDLEYTVGEIVNWVCDKGKLPTHVGIEVGDITALGKWILLEKPDILAQLQGQIEQITYDKLAENKDKIEAQITADTIANVTTHFSGIIHTVTVMEGKIQPIEQDIANLQQHASDVDDALQAMDDRDDKMDDRIDMLVNTTSIMAGDIIAIETRTGVLETRADQDSEDIAKLEETTQKHKEALENHKQEIEDLDAEVQDIRDTMDSAEMQVNADGTFRIEKGGN